MSRQHQRGGRSTPASAPARRLRCKNFYALGLVYWMFEPRPRATARLARAASSRTTRRSSHANVAALNAGHALGETAELPAAGRARSPARRSQPGLYRTVTGHEALAFGLLDGARKAGLQMVFCSYPITPASALLHHLAELRRAAASPPSRPRTRSPPPAPPSAPPMPAALGVTASSGPGIALKTEAIGLAVATELPLVIVNAQRGGPSTGLPTKTEQSDLYQAVYGRNGDAPIVVLAAATPADCFDGASRPCASPCTT